MKKTIILSGILCLLTSAEATARVDISVGLFGEPAPAYVEAPVYAAQPVYPTYIEEPRYYHEHHGRHEARGHHNKHDNHRR